MNELESIKYERAKKQVRSLKDFYNHLLVYLMVNIPLILIRTNTIPVLRLNIEGLELQSWVDWNTYGITFIWGIGLFINWILVFRFKPRFLKDWEHKKIKELINKEKNESNQRWN